MLTAATGGGRYIMYDAELVGPTPKKLFLKWERISPRPASPPGLKRMRSRQAFANPQSPIRNSRFGCCTRQPSPAVSSEVLGASVSPTDEADVWAVDGSADLAGTLDGGVVSEVAV